MSSYRNRNQTNTTQNESSTRSRSDEANFQSNDWAEWNSDALVASNWSNIPTKMRTKRKYFTSVSVGHCLYIIGGCADNDDQLAIFSEEIYLNSVDVYNTKTETWHQLPNMNEKRAGCASVVIENTIYVMGGENEQGDVLDTVEFFNLSSDSQRNGWVMLDSRMETGRFGFAAVAFEDCIYVMGGINNTEEFDENTVGLSSMEAYNTSIETWIPMPSMTSSWPIFPTVVLADYCIYIMGENDDSSNTMEYFNIMVDMWNSSSLPPMKTLRKFSSAVQISNKAFVVIGGTTEQDGLCSIVEAYHVDHQTWISLPDTNIQRYCGPSVLIDGSIYAVGGIIEDGASDIIEKIHLKSTSTLAPNPPILPQTPRQIDTIIKEQILNLQAHRTELVKSRRDYLNEVRELKDRRLANKNSRIEQLQNQISSCEKEYAKENEETDTIVSSWLAKIDQKLKDAKLQMDALNLLSEEDDKKKNNDSKNTATKKGAATAVTATTIPDELLCPITLQLMKDPVVAADGFTYERSAIERVLRESPHNARSPQTNRPLAHRHLTTSHTIRSMCRNFHEDDDNSSSSLFD